MRIRISWIILLLLVLAGLTACRGVHSATGHFSLENHSDDPVRPNVDGRDVPITIGPHQAVRFDAPIRVSDQTDLNSSPLEEEMNTLIVVHDLAQPSQEASVSCEAGMRVVTSLVYQTSAYTSGPGYVSCLSSVGYDRRPD